MHLKKTHFVVIKYLTALKFVCIFKLNLRCKSQLENRNSLQITEVFSNKIC